MLLSILHATDTQLYDGSRPTEEEVRDFLRCVSPEGDMKVGFDDFKESITNIPTLRKIVDRLMPKLVGETTELEQTNDIVETENEAAIGDNGDAVDDGADGYGGNSAPLVDGYANKDQYPVRMEIEGPALAVESSSSNLLPVAANVARRHGREIDVQNQEVEMQCVGAISQSLIQKSEHNNQHVYIENKSAESKNSIATKDKTPVRIQGKVKKAGVRAFTVKISDEPESEASEKKKGCWGFFCFTSSGQ